MVSFSVSPLEELVVDASEKPTTRPPNEIVGERPCDREHDARDDHEEHADENRENHQAHRDEELAHVAAVFAVENAQGIDNLTLGQLCGQ